MKGDRRVGSLCRHTCIKNRAVSRESCPGNRPSPATSLDPASTLHPAELAPSRRSRPPPCRREGCLPHVRCVRSALPHHWHTRTSSAQRRPAQARAVPAATIQISRRFLAVADLPYTEYSPGAAKRSWWSGGVFGALAFIGACGILSIASSQHAANQASAERLEALTQTLASIHPGGFIPAASPSAHKFAITGVTPTDFQMNRGDCWLFATVVLEDSYRCSGAWPAQARRVPV